MTEPLLDPTIHTLAPELKERLEALRPSEESFLPAVVVDMQRTLAQFSARELMHLIVGGAVQLAARDLGAPGPLKFLEASALAAEGMSGDAWLEKVAPEVRRLCHETWTERGHAPQIDPVPEAASEESLDVVAAPTTPDAR